VKHFHSALFLLFLTKTRNVQPEQADSKQTKHHRIMNNSIVADYCNESFPFEFFDANGTAIAGELGEDGLCTFPQANCGLDTSIDDCCKARESYTETGGKYMFIAFLFIFLPYIYLTRFAGSEEEPKEGEEKKESKEDQQMVPNWVKNIPILGWIFQYGLWISITMQIMVPIFMRTSLQAKLDVASRNALIAGEAFIVPYSEIFQFIEDIVLVRVNYAMARGYKKKTDQLVHAGIAGSLFTGIVAGIVGTILGVIPAALETLTNPGIENDKSLYPGCELITDNNDNILPYWLMEVWAIAGRQVGMVLSGFLLGAMELPTLGWIASISLAMTPIIWFTAVDDASNRLLLLSTAEFTSEWLLPILAILYVICPLGSELREKTGVGLSVTKLCNSFAALQGPQKNDGKPDATNDMHESEYKNATTEENALDPPLSEDEEKVNGGEETDASGEESTATLLLEGLKIMVMDVTIQMCTSLSIYLALANDAAEAYKLTALQSALPSYGTAYATGMAIMFKIAGPQLLAHKATKQFGVLARLTMISAYLLVPLIMGAVLPFREELAFDYGGNACAYAKDDQCLPFFTNVFGENATGGDFTLSFTFNFFVLGASADAIFCVLRSALLTLVDLAFMLKCTGIAFLVYIPCIIVATNVKPFAKHASAYFVAMYIPTSVLIVLFTVRLEVLIRRILRGEKGAWSDQKSNRRLATGAVSTEFTPQQQ
jgi:hypothetical protein